MKSVLAHSVGFAVSAPTMSDTIFPGDLWQIPGRDIRQKIDRELRSEGVLMQHRGRILEVFEVGKNIIGKNAARDGVVGRGVNLPGNSASMKLLGHGGVGQAAVNGGAMANHGLQNRSTIRAVGVDGCRHGVKARSVGPITEQKKLSQMVNASARP